MTSINLLRENAHLTPSSLMAGTKSSASLTTGVAWNTNNMTQIGSRSFRTYKNNPNLIDFLLKYSTQKTPTDLVNALPKYTKNITTRAPWAISLTRETIPINKHIWAKLWLYIQKHWSWKKTHQSLCRKLNVSYL